jgi:hypothetical protein
MHDDRLRHHQSRGMPAFVREEFVLADAHRLGRRQEGPGVHRITVIREEAHLGVVLRMDEVDAGLVDDVVQHLEIRGVACQRDEEPAVGFGAHEQELVGVGADQVERFRGEAQRAHEVRRRRTARAGDEDPLQCRPAGHLWSTAAW